jgi:cell pole-organizing protein PopZ
MSDAKSPPELSIDEILTTIRRIIAEDEQGGASATGGATAAAGAGGVSIAASASGSSAAGEAAGETKDEKPGDSDDILELTEALNEDGTTRHLAPIGGASARRAATLSQALPPEPPRPALRPEPQAQRRDAPNLRLTPAQPAADREPRLSRDLPLGAAERTLEDIVRDTLRPLLQAWLDENLPPLVERLVQAEIARVAREAGAA